MHLLLVWLVNALSLLALPYVFPWVKVDSFTAALIAALVPRGAGTSPDPGMNLPPRP